MLVPLPFACAFVIKAVRVGVRVESMRCVQPRRAVLLALGASSMAHVDDPLAEPSTTLRAFAMYQSGVETRAEMRLLAHHVHVELGEAESTPEGRGWLER